MYDTCLINLKVNLTLFYLTDSFLNVHGNSTTLRVRHQATRTEHTTQRTNLTHDGRHSDDNINISPTTFNFLDIFVETYIVSTGSLSSFLLVRSAEAEHADSLTRTIWKRNHATNHLVCLARIYTEAYVDIQ